mmetsp:Transcript_17663/g.38278  ORF Transcript_17663/g.38278 Transcript_17663/m.38278 type:complete len:301 (-) Transcript_17663:64-966(-)
MTRDVRRRRVDRQEFRHPRDLLRLSHAPQRNLLYHRVLHGVRQGVRHVRLNVPRTDAVHRDPPAGELPRVRHRQADHPPLRRRVVRLSLVPHLSDHRRDVDDPSGALLHLLLGSELEELLGRVEYSREVDVDDVLPLFGLHPHEESVRRDARVVDQDVAGAVLVDDRLEHFLYAGLVGAVRLNGDGVAARFLDGRHDLVRLVLAAGVVHHDLLPGLSQLERDGRSESARGARHEADLGVVGDHVESRGGCMRLPPGGSDAERRGGGEGRRRGGQRAEDECRCKLHRFSFVDYFAVPRDGE